MIRKATIKDAETIIIFNANLADETEGINLNRDKLIDGVYAILGDKTKGCYYLYEDNNRVVGQLMITYEWSDWRCAYFWWIQSVYVHPDYRKKGIFKKLYNYIKEMIKNDPTVCGIRLYVEKENAPALNTYQKLGMKENQYKFYEWKK